jgi:hypothetical protein
MGRVSQGTLSPTAVNLRCPTREMPRDRPTAPSCECREGNDAGAGATKRGLQRTRCAHLQSVSLLRCRDDRSGVVRAAVVCVLLRMNRGFQGCDVIASLPLLHLFSCNARRTKGLARAESPMVGVPPRGSSRPGLLAGESTLAADQYCVLWWFPCVNIPGFGPL